RLQLLAELAELALHLAPGRRDRQGRLGLPERLAAAAHPGEHVDDEAPRLEALRRRLAERLALAGERLALARERPREVAEAPLQGGDRRQRAQGLGVPVPEDSSADRQGLALALAGGRRVAGGGEDRPQVGE